MWCIFSWSTDFKYTLLYYIEEENRIDRIRRYVVSFRNDQYNAEIIDPLCIRKDNPVPR